METDLIVNEDCICKFKSFIHSAIKCFVHYFFFFPLKEI